MQKTRSWGSGTMECQMGAAMTSCLGGGQQRGSWIPNTLTVGHALCSILLSGIALVSACLQWLVRKHLSLFRSSTAGKKKNILSNYANFLSSSLKFQREPVNGSMALVTQPGTEVWDLLSVVGLVCFTGHLPGRALLGRWCLGSVQRAAAPGRGCFLAAWKQSQLTKYWLG